LFLSGAFRDNRPTWRGGDPEVAAESLFLGEFAMVAPTQPGDRTLVNGPGSIFASRAGHLTRNAMHIEHGRGLWPACA
jgi:hypothetical protein